MEGYVYLNPKSLEEAVDMLSASKAGHLVAGATNVMMDIRSKKLSAAALISIRDLKELSFIKNENGFLKIGSATSVAQIASSELIRESAPALYMAANVFADPITRNSATIGGNIANASPAADMAPSLLALDALVHVAGKRGEREIKIEEFFKGVGKTALEKDEIITHISCLPQPCSYVKMGLRNAMAITVVSAAVSVTGSIDKIEDCRIALGSVAPAPVRAKCAEAALRGAKFDKQAVEAMTQALPKDISPIDDLRASAGYRLNVASVLIERAVSLALTGN